MIKYQDYFQDGYRYALENVTYVRIPEKSPLPTEHSLVYADSFSVSDRDEQDVHVRYTRHTYFDPTGVFDITITFDLVFAFKKSNASKTITNDSIVELLENSEFTAEVIAKASLLISQITLLGTLNPVILPPNYNKNSSQE